MFIYLFFFLCPSIIYIYIYIYVYIYTHTYIYVYIYIYICKIWENDGNENYGQGLIRAHLYFVFQFILQLLLIVFHIFLCVFNFQEKKGSIYLVSDTRSHVTSLHPWINHQLQKMIIYMWSHLHSEKLVTGPESSSRSWWARFELVFLWFQDARVWCSQPTGVKRKHYE